MGTVAYQCESVDVVLILAHEVQNGTFTFSQKSHSLELTHPTINLMDITSKTKPMPPLALLGPRVIAEVARPGTEAYRVAQDLGATSGLPLTAPRTYGYVAPKKGGDNTVEVTTRLQNLAMLPMDPTLVKGRK